MRSVPYHYIVGCCSLVSVWIEEKEDGLLLCTCNDISRWPRLSNRHQNMHLTKLHTPFSHIPSQSPLCCPHNGNPNTQERFFPCKCKNHTGKKKNTQFKIHHAPKENNTLWSACTAGLTISCLSITLPAVHQLDKCWRIWPLHPSWTQAHLWIVVSLGSQIKLLNPVVTKKTKIIEYYYQNGYKADKVSFLSIISIKYYANCFSQWDFGKAMCNYIQSQGGSLFRLAPLQSVCR